MKQPKILVDKLKAVRLRQLRDRARLLKQQAALGEQLAHVSAAIFHLDRQIAMEGPTKPLGIVEGALAVFKARDGAPMTIRDLTRALESLGVQTESKRFGAAVYATIRASPKFTRLPDGTWQKSDDAPPHDAKVWARKQGQFLAGRK